MHTYTPIAEPGDLNAEDLDRLITTIAAEPIRALRFFLMVGLIASLPRHTSADFDDAEMEALQTAGVTTVDVAGARFQRDDGSPFVIDGSEQLPHLEFLWLMNDVASVEYEEVRRAALHHAVITTLADPAWICW